MFKLKPVHGVALAIGVAFGGLAYGQGQGNPAQSSMQSDKATGTTSSTDKSTTSRSAMRSDKSASDKLPRAERNFIEKAAQHNMGEIELGKIAEKNASSDEVKRYARQMVEDHTKANEDLKKVAQSKGIDMPTEADRSHRRAMDKMQKKTGADFDRDFVSDMVKDHKSDLKDFQKQARDAKDADIKSFAEKNESVIQKHLDMAQQLENSIKVAGKSERSPNTGASSPRSNPSAASGTTRSPSSGERSSSSSNR